MAEKVAASFSERVYKPRLRRVIALCLSLLLAMGIAASLRRFLSSPPRTELPAFPPPVNIPRVLLEHLTRAQTRASAADSTLSSIADLARLYHMNGYEKEARKCWLILHRSEPREARWTYYLADLAAHASDELEQGRRLRETVKLAPDYAPAWLELGQLDFKSGKLDEADSAYRRRLELLPNDSYAKLGLARIALQRGALAQGRRQLEELVQVDPNFSSARNLLAEILTEAGDTEGASRERWLGTISGRFRAADDPWKDELRLFCYDPDQYIVWGETDYLTKHGDLGRRALERAFELAPTNRRTIEMLARFYLDVGESTHARDLLEKNASLIDSSEALLAELSEAYMALDQSPLALQTAERGLSKIPDSASLYNARGLALASIERYDEAIGSYQEALRLAPGTSSASANLGLIYLLLGRKDEARAELQQALRVQPGYSKAVIALASLELEAGNLSTAYPYIISFYQESPGSQAARSLATRYYTALALSEEKSQKPEEAEKSYKDGLALVPDSPELHGLLGLHYTRAHRLPEAIAALEKSHQLQEDDSRVTILLSELYSATGRQAEAARLLREGAARAKSRGDVQTLSRYEALQKKPAQ